MSESRNIVTAVDYGFDFDETISKTSSKNAQLKSQNTDKIKTHNLLSRRNICSSSFFLGEETHQSNTLSTVKKYLKAGSLTLKQAAKEERSWQLGRATMDF